MNGEFTVIRRRQNNIVKMVRIQFEMIERLRPGRPIVHPSFRPIIRPVFISQCRLMSLCKSYTAYANVWHFAGGRRCRWNRFLLMLLFVRVQMQCNVLRGSIWRRNCSVTTLFGS